MLSATLGVSAPAHGRWACRADRIFDGQRVRADTAVIVDGDRIAALLPARDVPPGLPILAAPGCTLLPGLVDLHTHFTRWQGPLFLAHGVTTIRDVGNQLDWILARRGEWRSHPWPRIHTLGPLLDGPTPAHPGISLACGNAAAARQAVAHVAAAGVDGIKLYVGLRAEWLRGMVEEAHSHGLRVAMHCSDQTPASAAGAAGVDEFFHLDGLLADIWPDHPGGWLRAWGEPGAAQRLDHQQHLADRIKQLGMIATPTLAFWEGNCHARASGYPRPEAIGADTAGGVDAWRRALTAAQRFVGLLRAREVPVLAGTDAPCALLQPGRSLWRELSLLVECGMAPIASLCAATSGAAACLGNERIGRLAPGCAADMVVAKGDPTRDLPASPEVAAVVLAGQVLSPAVLLAQARRQLARSAPDPLEDEIPRPTRAGLDL
jgi:hypothetical protein